LRHKKLVLIVFTAAFIFSLMLTRFVGNEFIPEEDTGDMRININLPVGTRLEETDKIAQQIEDLLAKDVPEAEYYYVRAGSVRGLGRAFGGAQGSHTIAAGAKLVVKSQRKRSVEEVGQDIRRKRKNMPGIMKADISTGNPIGRLITGGGGKSIQLEIIGHSFEETDALAEKIKTILENIPGAVDVTISREFNRPELKIEIDREKSAALGLDMNTIANTLNTFIQGSTASKYREKGETYDIVVRLEESSRASIEDIENLSIISPLPEEKTAFSPLADSGALSGTSRKHVKLSNIAKISETAGPQDIDRKNRERVVQVECNVYKRSPGKIIEDLEGELAKIAIPTDIMINIGGEAEEQRKAFGYLVLLLMLGISLVYMVMAAQFESLLDPFIIMFAIPFTFIGVILGFVLTNTTLSVVTFLGIIMLMGIVVNNAIVLISYIQILRARGLAMYDAVTAGGRNRLRPILMTTITTIAGLMPLALSRGEGSEVWQPLGITMIGGLTVSTLITLLFVPTLYAVFHRKAAIAGGKQK